MKILFYTSFNIRSRDTESIIEGFIKEKNTVYILTQKSKGEYHEIGSKLGAKTYWSNVNRKPTWHFFLHHWTYLIYFSWKNKIDIVYAHLEEPGLVAVFAQYFIRAKVVVCRHIVDEAYLFNNRNFIILNKIVYTLARTIVVVSKRAKEFMIKKEKIDPHKIFLIPLGYNFNFYDSPNTAEVKKIKNKYKTNLLIITACRLVSAKRPMTSIIIIKKIIEMGLDCKLIILGSGPQENELAQFVNTNNLSNNVFILGHKKNIIDYMSAADLLLHPSILDSSSVIIKEAGLLKKLVLACKDVGDVNEYLINEVNSFLANKDFPEKDFITHIEHIIKAMDIKQKENITMNLHENITQLFHITKALTLYRSLHKTLGFQ